PWGQHKSFVIQKLDAEGRYQITIEDVGPAFPIGLTVKGIRMVSPPEKPGEKPSVMEIERLKFTVGIFQIFSKDRKVDVEIDALGGHIEAEVESKGKARKLKLKFDGVSMKRLPGISKAISLPMTGGLNGKGWIEIPEDGYRSAKGKFNLACKACTLGDGKTKVKIDFRPEHLKKTVADPVATEGVTLPKVRLGRFEGQIEIERGRAMFKQFEALSPDGEAQLLGTVALREPFPFSNVDAYFKFKFDEGLKVKEARWGAIEGSLGMGKRADGWIGFSVRGRFKDPPQFRPARFSSVERLYEKTARDTTKGRRDRAGSLRRPITPPRPKTIRGMSPTPPSPALPRPVLPPPARPEQPEAPDPTGSPDK
ncbi:MAG: type II secretion system protein GspN, partial [Polyangia bacterium]|nr:type II secretion system protein GspN [Polyangia bacterium]